MTLLRTLVLALLGWGALAGAETPGSPYPDHPGVGRSPNNYYPDILGKHPPDFGAPENEVLEAIRIQTSEVDPGYWVAPAPSIRRPDIDDCRTALCVDAAQKLTDASRLAREGWKATSARVTQLGLQVIFRGQSGYPTADIETEYQASIRQTGVFNNAGSATLFRDQHALGARRLRYDPSTGTNAETPEPETDAMAGADVDYRAWAEEILEGLPEAEKKKLADRGVDLVGLTEKMLRAPGKEDLASLLVEFGFEGDLPPLPTAGSGSDSPSGSDGGSAPEGAGGEAGGSAPSAVASMESEAWRRTDPRRAGIPFVLERAPVRAFPRSGGTPAEGLVRARDGRLVRRISTSAYYRLMARGILVPQYRQTIFGIAHRQYREYGRWRHTNRVVAAR